MDDCIFDESVKERACGVAAGIVAMMVVFEA